MEKYQLLSLIFLYCIINMFQFYLEFINYKWLIRFGHIVPYEFKGVIDKNLLIKTKNYTVDKLKLGLFSSIFDEIVLLVFIFAILNFFNNWLIQQNYSFVLHGILFFLIITYIKMFLNIPFSLYSTFKLEKKYDFNKITPKLWIIDFLKGLILSTILLGILLLGALLIIDNMRDFWWLPLWGFFFIFTMFIMYISPYVIEPLFNKFEPLDNPELEVEILDMCKSIGINISRIFKMDASKRTNHTNAYFTGFGQNKRIILYDTLLKKLENDEIIAVLAHEIGHWKRKHILKNLIIVESLSFIFAYLAFILLEGNELSIMFGIEQDSFFSKIILLNFIASIVLFPFSPIMNLISRIFEKEADDFACGLIGGGKNLASALVKLSKDNLSNLYPHPTYSKFHYSHPPIIDRIKYLKSKK